MKILLASNNRHKLLEMRGIVRYLSSTITISTPAEIGFSVDITEAGEDFGENAMTKARALWAFQNGKTFPGSTSMQKPSEIAAMIRGAGGPFPVISDDSGICVNALDGAPGLYSARFGSEILGPDANDRDRTELLLTRLENVAERNAHYTCNAVLLLSDSRFIQVQETWEGEIRHSYIEGSGGFGYDPVFYLSSFKCTVSQLPQEQKDRISHRAKAVNSVLRAAAILPPLT